MIWDPEKAGAFTGLELVCGASLDRCAMRPSHVEIWSSNMMIYWQRLNRFWILIDCGEFIIVRTELAVGDTRTRVFPRPFERFYRSSTRLFPPERLTVEGLEHRYCYNWSHPWNLKLSEVWKFCSRILIDDRSPGHEVRPQKILVDSLTSKLSKGKRFNLATPGVGGRQPQRNQRHKNASQ